MQELAKNKVIYRRLSISKAEALNYFSQKEDPYELN
jgi:hypothetical protein